MLMLLPQPQEMHVLPEKFRSQGPERLWIAPGTEPAALEVARASLTAFAGKPLATETFECDGCALVLAADAAHARALLDQARRQMSERVRSLKFCIDGGNMSEPTDGMGKPEAPPEGVGKLPESYTLICNAHGIALAATDAAGLFYGAQTLRQLLAGRTKECPGVAIRDFPSQNLRGVHIDMKYAFFGAGTIERMLREMAAYKLNCVLFEYEDKFPYQRHPCIVDKKNALTPEQIRHLSEVAREQHIEVIPLIQSLGHLEFALHQPEMAALREVPDGHTMLCPRNPQAVRFVQDMIDEVLAAHPGTRFLHVGGDEAYLLGFCPACKAVVAEKGKIGLYAEHIAGICQYVLNTGVRPIVWDDMIRTDPERLTLLPKGAVLAYWIYETVRERHGKRNLPPALEKFYGCAGKPPAELPDTLSTYPHFDYYRRQGYDVIAVPCLNPGTLVPNQEVATRNTATWAEKTNLCGGLGMLNSSWACFLIHPDATWYGIAQTADNTWWWPSVNRTNSDARFGDTFFGIPDPQVGEVMFGLQVGVGVPSKLKRPLSLLSFAYMEEVIDFEGNVELRQKLGVIYHRPMDMLNHVLRKLEVIQDESLAGEVWRQLEFCAPVLDSAVERLKALRPRAQRNAAVLELLQVFGELKRLRCDDWWLFLDAFAQCRVAAVPPKMRAQAAQLLERERGLRQRFEALHAASICASDTKIMTSRMFDGEMKLLELLAAGQPLPAPRRGDAARLADKATDVADF